MKIDPPMIFMAIMAISISVSLIPLRVYGFPWNCFGVVFIVFGIFFNLWTDSIFKKMQTTVKPYEKPTNFVRNGPFSISRNPMYLGMLSLLLGVAVLSANPITFLFPILFVIMIELFYIPMEERNMKKFFGKKYIDYKKKVRRWI